MASVEKVNLFIDLVTPQYLLLVVFGVLASFIFINKNVPPMEILLPIFSLCLATLGFNSINQVFDATYDRIDKPLRPIPSARIEPKKAFQISCMLYLSSIAVSIFVNVFFILVNLLFIAFSLIYTHPRTYLKRFFWASSVMGAILYAVIPFLTAISVSQTDITSPWFLVLAVVLIATIANTKDIEDIDGETRSNIESVPILIGIDATAKLVLAILFFTIISFLAAALIGIIGFKYVYPSVLSALFFFIFSYYFLRSVAHLRYKRILIEHLKDNTLKKIVTQSDFVTLSMVFVLTIEVLFALTAWLL